MKKRPAKRTEAKAKHKFSESEGALLKLIAQIIVDHVLYSEDDNSNAMSSFGESASKTKRPSKRKTRKQKRKKGSI